jgi:V/A-type H+/Na+-transporting ATPase subunit I
MMRPRPALWFEILCARQDLPALLEALGRSGIVELQGQGELALPGEWTGLDAGLAEFHALAARYAPFWPAPAARAPLMPESPAALLQASLAELREWARECEPAINALEAIGSAQEHCRLWADAMLAWREETGAVPAPPTNGGLKLWLVDPGASAIDLSRSGLARALHLSGERILWVLLARAEAVERIAPTIHAAQGRLLPAPAWLPRDIGFSREAAQAEQERLAREAAALRERIDAASARRGLAGLLADLHRLAWIVGCVGGLKASPLLVEVTGWSADRSGAAINAAVAASGARALVHFPARPADLDPPLLLDNPRWMQPFEFFASAFGIPGRNEADPTPIVAIAAPLMFGYMFGDVGQGAVLAIAGWWLGRRLPLARILLPAGIASMVFGLLYGSVFAVEHLIPALWLHPLAHPLTLLAVPLGFGALLLLVGLGLGALGAWWRGSLGAWWRHDWPVILVYLGLLAAPFTGAGWMLALAGVIWALAAEGLHSRSPGAMAAALGELLERIVQLLVNTLSFARVGAFALAHAGLSSAVVALAFAADSVIVTGLMLLLGNLLILVLEALVVSIQTTRLLLFEFFTRFLTGVGRVFRPLPPPPALAPESA